MPGQIVIEDVEITDNIAFDGFGGGMKIKKGNVTMSRVLFRNNTAKMSGGAISFQSDSVVTITSCSFIDSTAGSNGGALAADGQVLSQT
jgi:predicted outer membrane repeat protein